MAPYVSNPYSREALTWINGRYETVTQGYDGNWYRKGDDGKLVKVDPNDLYGMNSDDKIRERQLAELDEKIEDKKDKIKEKDNLLANLGETFYTSMKNASNFGHQLWSCLMDNGLNSASSIDDITDTDERERAEGLYTSKRDAKSMQHSALAAFLNNTHASIKLILEKGDLELQRIYLT